MGFVTLNEKMYLFPGLNGFDTLTVSVWFPPLPTFHWPTLRKLSASSPDNLRKEPSPLLTTAPRKLLNTIDV